MILADKLPGERLDITDFNAEARKILRACSGHPRFIGKIVSYINFHVLLSLKTIYYRPEKVDPIILISEKCAEPFFDEIFDVDYPGLNNYSTGGYCKIDPKLPAVYSTKDDFGSCFRQSVKTALNNPDLMVVLVLKDAKTLSEQIANQYSKIGNLLLIIEISDDEKGRNIIECFANKGWGVRLFDGENFNKFVEWITEHVVGIQSTVIFVRSSWNQILL